VNVIDAASGTLNTGDVVVAAPASTTFLELQGSGSYDLAAPAVLHGVTAVYDRTIGDSVIMLRAGLSLTLHLGSDSATVWGAAIDDTILGGSGYDTVHLGGADETVVAGPGGMTVTMTVADAGARIDGRGVTAITLTGQPGTAARLEATIQGVGLMVVTGAGLHVSTVTAGIGTVALEASATVLAVGSQTHAVIDYAGDNTVALTAPGQVLELPDASLDPPQSERVASLVAGDSIDVDMPFGASRFTYDASTGAARLTDTASGRVEVLMLPAGLSGLELSPDTGLPNGDTGTLITLGTDVRPAPCFAQGTTLLTGNGEVAVDYLRAGDAVVTLDGKARPIRWIGRRLVYCRRHRNPGVVQPVRITAGAFAPGVPRRDVVLSPDHAVFLGGGLVPVKYLVNGATIRQEDRSLVLYYHVELDRHDVVLAAGVPVETYLDTGNRAQFDNAGGATVLFPDFSPRAWPPAACAPLIVSGPLLHRARAGLLARAAALGWATTTDPDLRILAGQQRIWGRISGGVWSGWLPPRPGPITLLSRAQAPADCDLGSDDRRRLGVALQGATLISARGARRLDVSAPVFGPGFYPAESNGTECWRWTDGHGTLTEALWDGVAGPFRLLLALTGRLSYRLDPPQPDAETLPAASSA
jgi:hypothetical protein